MLRGMVLVMALGQAQDPAALIRDLEADDIETREAAAAALRKMGQAALAPVEKVLASTRNTEVKGRLQDLLGYLKCDHDGGPVVDGLRLHLSVDKEELRPGEEVQIKAVIWNTTGVPRRLEVGYTSSGNYFETGVRLEVLAPGSEAPSELRCHRFACGTGARPIFETIPAYGSKTYITKACIQADGDPRYLLGGGRWSAQVPPGETHRLRLKHQGRRHSSDSGEGTPWTGVIGSNEVQVRIAGRKN